MCDSAQSECECASVPQSLERKRNHKISTFEQWFVYGYKPSAIRQKSRITKKNSGQSPEERWLFHGTNKDIVEPICQQGFDWRLSGSKHGARYGKGSYFAVEASYSHRYSRVKAVDENYRVFMAKVIVGSYVVGSYETQRPPAKDPMNPLSALYDSCVNNVAQPTIFVVFERSQAYPYYIIDYTKETLANSGQTPVHSLVIPRPFPDKSPTSSGFIPSYSGTIHPGFIPSYSATIHPGFIPSYSGTIHPGSFPSYSPTIPPASFPGHSPTTPGVPRPFRDESPFPDSPFSDSPLWF